MSNVTPIKPVESIEEQIQNAAAEWVGAKLDEKLANARRLAAEQKLCALIPPKKEGSKKVEHGLYAITLTGKLDRDIDAEKLVDMDKKIPASILNRLIKYEPKLVLTELRYIEENEPHYYQAFAEALTVTPAKTSVKVEIK